MKELLQMALDALEYHTQQTRPIQRTEAAILALREALAAPQAEPVAWAMLRADGLVLDVICPDERDAYQGEYTVPLYAAPPAAPAPAVPEGDVVVSKDEAGQIVAVTRQDAEGRILSVIAESTAPAVPLTDKQIEACIHLVDEKFGLFAFARAIEQAHGTGGGGNG